MGSIITYTFTVFYSLSYLNSLLNFDELKYVNSVISLILNLLSCASAKKSAIDPFVDGRVRLCNPWADSSLVDVLSYSCEVVAFMGLLNMYILL